MKRTHFLLFAALLASSFFASQLRAQCTLQTLSPMADTLFRDGFGNSFAVDGNIAAVGVPNKAHTDGGSGLVYVFEKTNDQWDMIAELRASDSSYTLSFGYDVVLDGDVIAVMATDFNYQKAPGSQLPVYIYHKPASGTWEDATEDQRLIPWTLIDANGFTEDMDLHNNTLVVTGRSAIYVYEYTNTQFEQLAALRQSGPSLYFEFGRVYVNDSTIAAFNGRGGSDIYVYNKPAQGWSSQDEDAILTIRPRAEIESAGFGGHLVFDGNQIIAVASFRHYENAEYTYEDGALVFSRGASGWVDTTQTAFIQMNRDRRYLYSYIARTTDGIMIKVSGGSDLYYFKKPVTGWIDAFEDMIIRCEGPGDQHYYDHFQVYDDNLYILCSARSGVKAISQIHEYNKPAVSWDTLEYYDNVIGHIQVGADGDRFGTDIAIYGDLMVVGATGDDSHAASINVGIAYVYQHVNNAWEQIAILRSTTGQPYDNFGRHVAINDNFIAIAAPLRDSIDAAGEEVFNNIGAVYIYRKPAGGWVDAFEDYMIQSPAIHEDNSFAIDVNMGDSTLVVTEYTSRIIPSTGRLHVYELDGSGNWIHQAIIQPEEGEDIDNFGRSVSMNDSVIVVGSGEAWLYGFRQGASFVYEKEGDSWANYSRVAALQSSSDHQGSLFGYDVFLYGDKILVGAPGYDNGEEASGRIFLFERAGDSWQAYNETAQFASSFDQRNETVGYSVYMNDNYIVTGAVLIDQQNDGFALDYGTAYAFRKGDGDWKSGTEMQVILSGNLRTGLEFGLYDETVIVASYNDLSDVGGLTGAVKIYPLTYIEAPDASCAKDTLSIELNAFPQSGIWSGSGIINTSTGTFNPGAAGEGIHDIRYTIAQCTYSHKLIKVLGDSNPVIDDEQVHFCENDTFHITSNYPESTYQWFYGENGIDFEALPNATSREISAATAGYYMLNVQNLCSNLYDTIEAVSYELMIEPVDEICRGEQIELSAYPEGGRWYGRGIERYTNIFDSNDARVGENYIWYSYSGCSYDVSTYLTVIRAPGNQSYLQDQVYFCGDTLYYSIPYHSVDWYFSNPGAQFEMIEEDTNSIAIHTYGSLVADVHNKCGSVTDTLLIKYIDIQTVGAVDICSDEEPLYLNAEPEGGIWKLNGYELNPHIPPGTFEQGAYELIYEYTEGNCTYYDTVQLITRATPALSFEATEYEYCASEELRLSPGSNLNELQYEWFYSEDGNGFNFANPVTTDSVIVKPEGGYYRVRAFNQQCEALSPEIYVIRNERDSLYIPNVVTPNNDGFNDNFELYSENIFDTSLSVYDRYGKLVHHAENEMTWSNIDVPSAVYYYHFTYRDRCSKNQKLAKGYVQVLR